LVFKDDMCLASIDSLAANRIDDHDALAFSRDSIELPPALRVSAPAPRHALQVMPSTRSSIMELRLSVAVVRETVENFAPSHHGKVKRPWGKRSPSLIVPRHLALA